MQIDRMKKHLDDALLVKGDLIEFGIYKGTTFEHLILAAVKHGRVAHGVDSFEGLPAPTLEDRNSNNTIAHQKGKFAANYKLVHNALAGKYPDNSFVLHRGWIPDILSEIPDTSFAFAIVDLTNYHPTKQALAYVWEKMSYGGTLYFDNFLQTENSGCTKAIKEFIAEHEDELNVSRQMMINGIRETALAVKCLRHELRPRDWSVEKLLKRPLTFALVLKTGGGVYDYKYVNNLVEGIKSNLSLPHRIVCLTDNAKGITKEVDEIVKLKHDWPKWWGKIELFRPDLFREDQVFYFDLDTIITGSLDEIAFYDGEFCALRDFYHLSTMGSGLMSWHGDRVIRIYDEFKQNPRHYMQKFQNSGDQGFISFYKPSIEYFQDAFPKNVVSYKVDCQQQIPKKAKVVCFHGKPRPHEVKGEIGKYWRQ